MQLSGMPRFHVHNLLLPGKHHIENEAISQVISLLNEPMAEGANVRIMSDVHAGSGCVIGYTAKKTDRI